MKKYLKPLYNGIIKENPTFVLMLGMCPTLAVTTSAMNGMGMGLTTMTVLIMSNFVISLLRKIIPSRMRIPAYIVIVASLVTVVQLLLQAYIPSLYDTLGIYIPLIVVNCIILGRAEAFASKNNPLLSIMDGLGMGLGFTLALTSIGLVREILGSGTAFSMTLPISFEPITIFVMAPGAFFILALLTAIQNKLKLPSATNVQNSSLKCGGDCLHCHGSQCQINKSLLKEDPEKMKTLILTLISVSLVNNVVLSQFLGLCPFLGVSKQTKTALSMGGAVIFVITIASAVTHVLYRLLVLLHVEYLETVTFILIIAALVQLVELFLKKYSTALYNALGVYLPLITTNCAVLGVALTNVQNHYNFITSVVAGFGTALGFTISITILAGIRERIADNDIPHVLQGSPIVLITAGLMAIAFIGFSGLI